MITKLRAHIAELLDEISRLRNQSMQLANLKSLPSFDTPDTQPQNPSLSPAEPSDLGDFERLVPIYIDDLLPPNQEGADQARLACFSFLHKHRRTIKLVYRYPIPRSKPCHRNRKKEVLA